MHALSSGGTFNEISKTNFSTLQIPLPPIEVQREIVVRIERSQENIVEYTRKINDERQIIENTISEAWG